MATLGDADEQGDGIFSLVKETASGLGQLVADHIHLARIEMTADAKGYARDVGMLMAGGFILAIGYGLACIAAATALARAIGTPLAYLGLALLHMAIGAIAFALILGRIKRVQVMRGTKQEVGRSVAALTERSH
jgi:hypothetical protein